MQSLRVGAASAAPVSITVDGAPVTAREGDTIAAALIALGNAGFTYTRDGAPRGIFCGMGSCYDCLVTVDGERSLRACMTLVRPGMQVTLEEARRP